MHTRIFRLLAAAMLLSGLLIRPLWAVSHKDIQGLLDQYGKEALIKAVLELRANQITVFAGGRFKQFAGPPSPEFVTAETITRDVEKAGADLGDLREILESRPEHGETAKSSKMEVEVASIRASKKPSSPSPSASPALKQAALNCRILEFFDHMPASTRKLIKRLEAIRTDMENALDELYAVGVQYFGRRVQRVGNELRFHYNAKDPRWAELLGPQLAGMLRQMGGNSPYFNIKVTVSMEDECRLLRSFQACLENERLCREQSSDDSSLAIKKIDGTWQITTAKTPEEWQQALLFAGKLTEILRRGKREIVNGKKRGASDDELMFSLAKGYFEKLQAIAREISKAGVG